MPLVRTSPFRYLYIVLLAWLCVFFLTRSLLLVTHLAEVELGLLNLLRLYGVGFGYDLGFLLYASMPLSIYLFLCPNTLWQRQWHQHQRIFGHHPMDRRDRGWWHRCHRNH